MINSIKQECPLCGAEAEFVPKDFGRAKYFLCSAGCEYFIFTENENRLKSLNKSLQNALSEKAKQREDGSILVIRSPVPPQDQVEITADFLSRQEWLR